MKETGKQQRNLPHFHCVH